MMVLLLLLVLLVRMMSGGRLMQVLLLLVLLLLLDVLLMFRRDVGVDRHVHGEVEWEGILGSRGDAIVVLPETDGRGLVGHANVLWGRVAPCLERGCGCRHGLHGLPVPEWGDPRLGVM